MTTAVVEQGELEPVTTEQIADRAYDRLGLDDYLTGYAEGRFDDEDVEPVLAQFSNDLADLSFQDGNIDIDLVRTAFDRLTDGYNIAANGVFGPAPALTMSRAILETLKIVQPRQKQYYSKMDERYWHVQFPEQLEEESMVSRQPEETNKEYYERYLQACMKGLSWANFTYIRGAL